MATAVQVESILGGLTDNSGQPLAAGKVYTYYAGTTTPVSLYTASDKSTSATNPLVLDGHGKAQVWADGRYKFVVKDQYDVTQYTLDNLLYGFDDSTVLWGGQSTGSANVHNVSVPATVGVYSNGQRVSFIAGYTNTGATTLQLNTLGAVSIVKGPNATSLQAGDIVAGQLVDCVYEAYSGTGRFRLESSPAVADIQRSRYVYASNVGGTNTIVAELSPALSSYETGLAIRFKATATNTGAVTINLNSLGSKAIQRYGVALVGGEIKADDIVELVYDGAQFQLLNFAQAPLFIDRTNNRVGIGTTSPVDALEVATTGFYPQYWTVYTGASAGGANLMIRKSRGATVGTNTIVANNDVIGSFDFAGANGTTYTSCANIGVAIDGVPGATNNMPGRLSFATTGNGSGTPTERLRIDNSGNLAWWGGNSFGRIKGLYNSAAPNQTYTAISQNWNYATNTADSTGNGTASILLDGGASNYSAVRFATSINNSVPIERMRVTSDGNVLIGSTTNAAGARLKIETAHASGQFAECLSFQQPNALDNAIQAITFRNYSGYAATISCAQNSLSNFYANLSFTTTYDGHKERFAIRDGLKVFNNGALLIESTAIAAYGGSTMTYNTSTGYVGFSGSSRLIKENIVDCPYGLQTIISLLPRYFYNTASNKNEVGFIADEVLEIIPEVVLFGKKSLFTQVDEDLEEIPVALEYDKVTAILCKAIQELNAKVDSLEAQLRGA